MFQSIFYHRFTELGNAYITYNWYMEVNLLHIYVHPPKLFELESDCSQFPHYNQLSKGTPYPARKNPINPIQLMNQDWRNMETNLMIAYHQNTLNFICLPLFHKPIYLFLAQFISFTISSLNCSSIRFGNEDLNVSFITQKNHYGFTKSCCWY